MAAKKDINKMTRVELAKELHKTYLKTGSKPIGSKKPLSEREYVYRYVYGSTKFSKDVLKRFVSDARKGYYHGFKV